MSRPGPAEPGTGLRFALAAGEQLFGKINCSQLLLKINFSAVDRVGSRIDMQTAPVPAGAPCSGPSPGLAAHGHALFFNI